MGRSKKQKWTDYEKFAKHVISEASHLLGINNVQGKKIMKGKLTEWEIEVSGYDNNGKLIIVECKHRSKATLSQESIGGFVYRMSDLGAEKGIVVTTKGLQKGAKKIARGHLIDTIKLNEPFDFDNYTAQICEVLFTKMTAKPIKVMPKIEAKAVKALEVTINARPKMQAEIIKNK